MAIFDFGPAMGQTGPVAFSRHMHRGPISLFLFVSKFYGLELNTVLVFDLYNYGIYKQC
jgi:hypothetical protein